MSPFSPSTPTAGVRMPSRWRYSPSSPGCPRPRPEGDDGRGLPDPARWLADLMKVQHTVLWPAGDISGTSETLAAAATSWTKAVADLTAWQLSTLQQMTAPWTATLPGVSAATEPVKDKRFAGEA